MMRMLGFFADLIHLSECRSVVATNAVMVIIVQTECAVQNAELCTMKRRDATQETTL
jgi:hypothetical protein